MDMESEQRASTRILRAAYKQHTAAYLHTDYYMCSVFDIALAQSTARRSSLLAGCDRWREHERPLFVSVTWRARHSRGGYVGIENENILP